MAIGSNHVVQSCVTDVRDTSGFIPELWSREILRAYQQENLFRANELWAQRCQTDAKAYFIGTPFNPRTWVDGS